MKKLQFVPVDGYSIRRCVWGEENFEILTVPILGLYVARHAWAVEALTVYGDVVELFSFCVLECPCGKLSYAGHVFADDEAWLDWAFDLECECCDCRAETV